MGRNDHVALRTCAEQGGTLCTLVGIEGSFSRRLGAQIALLPDGRTVGSLSDGCLERQLASDALELRACGARSGVLRYGRGSHLIDFRLPCGSGLDVLIDSVPERPALQSAVDMLANRQEAIVSLPLPSGRNDALLARRRYIPSLRLVLFGDGPEYHAVAGLADAMGIELDGHRPATAQRRGLALGQGPMDLTVDPWTAIILLFHDHEWDRALLRWAVTTPAFFIGAQGGARAREQRGAALVTDGISAAAISRIRSPIGLFPHARDPDVLALSILAGVVSEFEALHPHP